MSYENYIIISDFDGTLTDNNGILRPGEGEAINIFTSKGGKFGISTGRDKYHIVNIFKDININFPWILYNGALIMDCNGSTLRSRPLGESYKSMIKILYNIFPSTMIRVSLDNKDGIYTVYYANILDVILKEIIKLEHYKDNIDYFKNLWTPKDEDIINLNSINSICYKIIVNGSIDTILEIVDWFNKSEFTTEYSITCSSPFSLEITSKGVSKGDALCFLRRTMCDKEKKIIVLGDEENDLLAFEYADISFASALSIDKIKKCSDRILKPDEPSICQVMELINSMKI